MRESIEKNRRESTRKDAASNKICEKPYACRKKAEEKKNAMRPKPDPAASSKKDDSEAWLHSYCDEGLLRPLESKMRGGQDYFFAEKNPDYLSYVTIELLFPDLPGFPKI